MKRIFGLLMVLAMVVGLSVPAHATLILRGTDTLGNRLIYDDDLNITWYDYTKSYDEWLNQVNWADALSVTFGSTDYEDWRLPSTVDGQFVFGYDGTTTGGYNITSSEMGHLFYTELGNTGGYDTAGNPTGCSSFSPYCLTNTGDFQNMQAYDYWSGTESSSDNYSVWHFNFANGYQGVNFEYFTNYAMAVRPGDVSTSVPEPATMFLLGSGLAWMAVLRKRLGRREG